MATLFERIIGINLGGGSPEEEHGKVPIHPFITALYELERGNLTQNQVDQVFNLSTSQASDAAILYGYIADVPNKADMIRVMKDWFYVAEWGRGITLVENRYHNESNLITRLEEEKSRQLGSPNP